MNKYSNNPLYLVLLYSFFSAIIITGCTTLPSSKNSQLEPKASQETSPKNVIIFIGDGMGVSTVTAARIFEGQSLGGTGEEHVLPWEKFPHVGLVKTYNTNQQVPDSAGTASAIFTGTKTRAGVISVGPAPNRGDCVASQQHHVPTLMERAQLAGYALGVVTTTRLTHATPAATYAHTPERDWENDSKMPVSAIKAGCRDIAKQFVGFNGFDIALAGGRSQFYSKSMRDEEYNNVYGERHDGLDLISQWQTKNPTGTYVWNKEQFDDMGGGFSGPILGLFEPGHLGYEIERARQKTQDPTLEQMTVRAIDVLKSKGKPFVLLIEAGRIDHGHHAGSAIKALSETVELSKAVAAAEEETDDQETLIIVTADHSHVFTMAGYPVRGNPILGKVISNDRSGNPDADFVNAKDGMPYTTLGYHNGRGAMNKPRHDLTAIDTESSEYIQQAGIPMNAETHGGEDVPIYSIGPNSEQLSRVIEQNYIFEVIANTLGL